MNKPQAEKLVRYTLEEARQLPDLSDWERVDAFTEEELTVNALSDPDNPPLDDEFFKNAKRMSLEQFMRSRKKQVTLRLDADVLDWFKSQGKGYQTRINAVLRAYREATR